MKRFPYSRATIKNSAIKRVSGESSSTNAFPPFKSVIFPLDERASTSHFIERVVKEAQSDKRMSVVLFFETLPKNT